MAKFYNTCLKLSIVLLFLVLFILPAQATHLKGGYISYTADASNPLKISITLTTYIDIVKTSADNPRVRLHFGDNQSIETERSSKTIINFGTAVNIYKTEHIFPAPGTFNISYTEINRTLGINNIANSETQSFYISTQIKIDPFTSLNNSVLSLNPPVNDIYLTSTAPKTIFNLAAYDIDNDSLSYELITPLRNTGTPENPRSGLVSGYRMPEFASINPRTGDLILDNTANLVQQGNYSFAIKITEYRKNMPIAYTVIDFLILIRTTTPALNPILTITNRASLPINSSNIISLNANQNITLQVQFTEPQATTLKLLAYSELLTSNKATFTQATAGNTISGTFTFIPPAALKRNTPYLVVFQGIASNATNEVPVFLSIPILVEAKMPTSVRDGADASIINAYPNPADNFITIKHALFKANHQLVIYDILGKVVKKQPLTATSFTTLTREDISKSGHYFYTISDGLVIKQSGRFIFR